MAPALGLFFLAPLTAEYLTGYDESTGHFWTLLAGLSILAPLYGGAALIIREAARRGGRGWPTMILLALAFGVLQAGLIDQSLFNPSYGEIDSWEDHLRPTYIPALGIGAYLALDFLPGHVIWSIAVPIAIVETFVPGRRATPWLGKLGSAVTGVLYLLASALVWWDHAQTERFMASTPQLAGAATVVVLLIGAAFLVGRRPPPPVDARPPSPGRVGTAAFALLSAPYLLEWALAWVGAGARFVVGWPGVALTVGLITALTVVVGRWSQGAAWSAAHRLALAGGALLTRAWLAFLVTPLGEVAVHRKLIHNTGFALAAVALLVMGFRVVRRTEETA